MPKIIKKHGKTALILGLILVLIGFYYLAPLVKAGTISSYKDTLSDSRPSPVKSNHTIQFTIATAVHASDTVTITFASGFTIGSVDYTDIDLKDDGTDLTLAATPGSGAGSALGAAFSGQVLTITENDTDTIAASSVVNIEIGTNATYGVTGDQQIQNPTAAVYSITIGGTFGDTGTIKVAIITGVTVSATVSEALTVTVAAVADTSCTVTGGTSKVTTTSSTVPFGSVTTEDFYDGCQSLTVNTNAASGYSATIQETDQLTSGSYQIADGTCDGSCSDTTAATWATDTNNGFAYCMDDISGDAAYTADNTGWATNNQCGGSNQSFKTIADAGASETAQAVMSSAGAISGDNSYVGFRLSVDAAQQPGTYSNTVVYIVTPTY